MQKKFLSGFTLVELIVVIAIVAVLVAVATPAYYSYVMKSRRADAKVALSEIAQRLEGYYADNNKYATDFDKLKLNNAGFVKKGSSYQSKDGWYQLSIEVDGTAQKYTLKATPQGAQSGDGKCLEFSLDSTGKKAVTGAAKNNVKECW